MYASSYLWTIVPALTVSKTFTDYHLIFVFYNNIISLFNHTPLSIFQHPIHKNIINLHIHNNMMYTSNYQWTTISTFPVIDNFQLLSTYLILCILVKYIIPWS